MRAKSTGLRVTIAPRRSRPSARLSFAERRAQIIAKACDFFADYGLTAQTRSLASACGISQRLLYGIFPSNAALLGEVYRQAILHPFKAVWLEELTDRRRGIEQRLNEFYREYASVVLTRQWMRLFLYASLADSNMAPDYISGIIMRLLDTVVAETADALGTALPEDRALAHEIGWTLHGPVSHLAIRRHVYGASRSVPEATIIALYVRNFLAGFPSAVAASQKAVDEQPGSVEVFN